ncbi:hypothetical protein [Burkholderia ubonensis]|uniref:hypothetical protein n=1 Tax=Burkholderia ubonensis TaxID=101571 RepID=UPI000A3DB159|nr:hypothetical protein [Burkholderia ubonensis]
MFQDVKDADTAEFQAFSTRFEHCKGILHGVMFVFRPRGAGVLAYNLQQVMVWNRSLVSRTLGTSLMEQMARALPAKE